MRYHRFATVLVLFLVAACANQPLNQPLTALPPASFPQNYSFDFYIDARAAARALPAYPIIITMSGGGIRATALAADIIRELRQFTRNGHPLTDDVILVSGTSGGSFAATAFAVHGNDPVAFEKFYSDFVERTDNTSSLAGSLLVPWRWDELVTNRTKQFAKLLDDRLHLNGETYAGLAAQTDGAWRPFLILNSTDYGASAPFIFTQDYFSLICSDLNPYPLALATAAAGAFPFLLSDVELENLRDRPCPVSPSTLSPEVIDDRRFDRIEQLRHERYAYELSNAFNPHAPIPRQRANVKWLHLFDGGLVDNMGIRAAANLFTDHMMRTLVTKVYGETNQTPAIPAMLHIMINAGNNRQSDVDFSQGSPDWLAIAPNAVTTPIDTVSNLSAWAIQEYIALLFANVSPSDVNAYPQSFRTVEIDFDLLDANDPNTQKWRDTVASESLLSQLDVDDATRTAIWTVADALLMGNPCFQDYVTATGVAAPVGFPLAQAGSCTPIKPAIARPPHQVPFIQKIEIQVPPVPGTAR